MKYYINTTYIYEILNNKQVINCIFCVQGTKYSVLHAQTHMMLMAVLEDGFYYNSSLI